MAKNLVKRKNGKYAVLYSVPAKHRALLGRNQIWKTTGTSDLREAERRKHRIIAKIQNRMDREVELARGGKFTEELATNPRSEEYVRAAAESLWAQVQAGELATDDAQEILWNYMQDHLKASKVDPESVSGDQLALLRNANALVANLDSLPLAKAVDEYLTENEKKWPLSTWKRKRQWLTSFKEWAGNPDINAITRKVAGRYMSEVLQPMDASWSTKSWALSALSPFFAWAIRRGLYEAANPWTDMSADIAESKRGKVKKTKRRPWTSEELKALSKLPDDDPLHSVAMFSLWAGLRTEEACRLKVKDINLKDRFLVVAEGKNDHSVRQIPIHSALLPLTEKLVKASKGSKGGWLIPGLKEAGPDKKRSHNLSKRASRWVRSHVTKDPGVVLYSLRKTFGTALENAGVDLTRRQRLMGHVPGDITSAVYSAGPDLETLREAIEKIHFDL